MNSAEHEHKNLFSSNPAKAEELKILLENWEGTLLRQVGNIGLNTEEKSWYEYFL